MFLFILFVSLSTFSQDLPTYFLPDVIVTPMSDYAEPNPDVVVKVPATVSPKAATLDDVLRGAPGVVVTRAGGPGQPSTLFIRGASSEHTLVLLDGIHINDPAQPSGGFDFSTIDLNLVDRIEIFKGPEALRFGSGAMGGVVNIVTKKGEAPNAFVASVRAGSYQTNQQSVAAIGQSSQVRYAVSASRFESSGISAAKGGAEKDGHNYVSGALRLNWGDEKHEWEFISRTLSSHSDLDFATANTGPYYLEPDDPNYFVDDFQTINAVKRHMREGDFTSTSSLAFFHLHRRYENKIDERNPAYFLDNRFSNSIQLNQTYSWRLPPNSSISFGPSFKQDHGKSSESLTGVFADYKYVRKFRLQVGARYDHHSRFGGHISYALAPGYRWSMSRTTLSGRLATAFKAPSLFQLHDATYGDKKLLPERVLGEEVALEQLVGESHTFRVTGFRYGYQDLIQFTTKYQNVAAAQTRGLELEYNKDMLESLNVQLAYTYLDARNEKTGARLLRRPFHNWRAGMGFKFSDRTSMRAEYRGVGSRPDIDALSAAATHAAAYDVMDISASHSLRKNLRLTASIENAFGQDYQEISGYGVPGFSLYIGLRIED